jgi:hypothetical protein
MSVSPRTLAAVHQHQYEPEDIAGLLVGRLLTDDGPQEFSD